MPIVGHVRAGARRYGALLALPGARGPVFASVAGSMPIRLLGAARRRRAPSTVTEAFAVLVMAIVAGTAAGNALGGALVDAASYRTAALAAAAVAVGGATVPLGLRRTLSARAA